MATSPTDFSVHHFEGADGTRLAYREIGEGRPIILIHGLASSSFINWLRYGHAQKVAAQGYRVIMPDLRGHGESDKPHDPAAYLPDILADDGFALVRHLGLVDYDLGGYSLGGRTTVRMLARGARPGRAIVSGMGLDGILNTQGRGGFFRRVFSNPGTFERGSAEWMAEAFVKSSGGDPAALLLILDTFVDTTRAELASIDMPVMVLTGVEDQDNGSAEALAEALPAGDYHSMPGNHMSAVVKPDFGDAIASWLAS